ncbi:hypothetical protein CUZ56_01895 [Saezia sanguinis]|uniref:Uncharacterized protein n=1 Tax=Saezia sanguinis TaxID=1965230 RepID=A0A433SCZ5_9BURK|nr:hypothetical protein [Saezia sanguinis]RUS66615.1 hypothetical protein CUZ56_01895 [Saezia sanguinis]
MNRHTSTHRPSPQRRKKSGFTVLPLLLTALSLSLWPRTRRNAPDKTDEQPKEPPDSDSTTSVQQSETGPSSSNENIEQEDASTSPPMPMNHLEGVLVWVQKRIWPLSASTLSLSALSLFLYSWLFHAPINITSPSMIAALPVIFALTIVLEIFLVLLVLAPTALLFVAPSSDKKALVFQLKEKPDPKILRRWFQSSLTMTVILLIVIFGGSQISPGHETLRSWILIPLCILTHMSFMLEQNSESAHSKWQWKNLRCISPDYLGVLTYGSILQLFLNLNALEMAVKFVSDWKYPDLVLLIVAAVISICIVVVMSVFQYLAIQVAVDKNFYEKLKSQKSVTALLFGLLFVFTAFLGAYCIDAIFRQTASGGRECVQLTWAQDTAPGVPSALVNPDNTAVSHPLRILLQADGDYQIGLIGDASKTVYFVSRTRVAALASCPSTSAQKVQD